MCAAKKCSHVYLVRLHLELVGVDLLPAPLDSEGGKWSETNDDVDDDVAGSQPSSPIDPMQEWQAKFQFEHYRLHEDSIATRSLIDSWRHSCNPACPSRGQCGKGDSACEHTFPVEFRPPPDRKTCAKCGAHCVCPPVARCHVWLQIPRSRLRVSLQSPTPCCIHIPASLRASSVGSVSVHAAPPTTLILLIKVYSYSSLTANTMHAQAYTATPPNDFTLCLCSGTGAPK